MKVPAGFIWHRPVPANWSRELATLTPKSETAPWLLLAWLPGDPWAPVQRWGIYEMVPLHAWWEIIQKHRHRGHKAEQTWEYNILQELEGPNPRDTGYFDTVLNRFVSDAAITRQEWELFHEHKAVPKIFWVIQGSHGGHQRFFSQAQQKLLRGAQLPAEPPAPGSLPYAEFDGRVLDLLARHDRLRNLRVTDEAQQVAARKMVLDLLDNQMGNLLQGQKISLDNVPKADTEGQKVIAEQMEREVAQWVQSGSTNGDQRGE